MKRVTIMSVIHTHTRRKLGLFTKAKRAKKKPVKFKKLTVVLLAVGALMVVTSFIIEASNYPWERLLGLASQSEDSVPDPSPLDFPVLTSLPPELLNPSPAAAEALPEGHGQAAVMTVLPGDEEYWATTETIEEYNFQVLGVLKIPVLKVSQHLLEGSGKQMKFGVGHVIGTAMPGQHGNCVVSGHRPYPFRYLDQLVPGDNIIIKMDKMVYTYQAYDSFEVLPRETWVLNDIWGEKYTLTLITCTPYMVSSHRLIIRARLVDINGQTPAAYYGEEEILESPSPEPSVTELPGELPGDTTPAETPALPSESALPTESPSAESPSAEPTSDIPPVTESPPAPSPDIIELPG